MGRIQKKKNVQPRPYGGNRFSWVPEATELFLNLWQQNVRNLRGTSTNSYIYSEIAKGMCIYDVTRTEVKTKVDNMKKKYRKEVNLSRETGYPSLWIYFKQMDEILTESKSFSMCMDDSFDFSPLDDFSDSSSFSSFWTNNETTTNEQPKAPTPEVDVNNTPEKDDSWEIDLSPLPNTDESTSKDDAQTESDDILAIERARLAVQKEKLKIMKTMADELSSIHREFLKAYKKYK